MFQKEHSSTNSQGKKGKDVAVRKSDRRRLLQSALNSFGITAEDRSQTGDRDPLDTKLAPAIALLEDAFLKGDLVQRPLKLPTARVTLYLRSAASEHGPTELDSTPPLSVLQQSLARWPYTNLQQCIWLTYDDGGRTNWQVPSVALLACLPTDLLPAVIIPTHASKFICRGAHVMRAGILRAPPPSGLRHENAAVVAVCVHGNPQPFGVGVWQNGLIGAGTQGIGVTVLSCYGDDIWKQQYLCVQKHVLNPVDVSPFGGAFDDGNYGNVGFTDGCMVQPISIIESNKEESDASVMKIEEGNELAKEAETELNFDEETSAIAAEEDEEVSPEEILHASVCKALVSLNVKKDLPMRMATFYAQHVIPSRPVGTTIQLKQTKYKKFAAYISEQLRDGLLTVSPDPGKTDPMGMLSGYDRRHEDVKEFIQLRKNQIANGNDPSTAAGSKRKLLLVDLFCIPNHFVALLNLDRSDVKASNATSAERRNTGMLTVKEVRTVLEDFLVREELVHASRPDEVALNGPLTDALYKKKKKRSSEAKDTTPTHLSRKDVMKLWESSMEPAYALVQVPGSAILKLGRGKPPYVMIEVIRRQSNKFQTKVIGLEAFGIAADVFSKDVAHRLACSASLTPSVSLNGPTEVLFQGNLSNELEALLLSDERLTSHGGVKGSEYSLPQHSVQVVLRKGVPKQKRPNGASRR